jgi:hypothetical protein
MSQNSLSKLSIFLESDEAQSWIEFLEKVSPSFYETFTRIPEESNDMYFAGKSLLKSLCEIFPKNEAKLVEEISNAENQEIAIVVFLPSHELAALSKFIRKCTIVDFEKIISNSYKCKHIVKSTWKMKEMLRWIGANIDTSSPL